MSLPLLKLERAKIDKLIMIPFEYLNKVSSKYHQKLMLAMNHWLRVPEDKVQQIGEILQIIHTVTLMVDDIQDDSKLRYGMPATHQVHGIGQTINAASNALAITRILHEYKKILALGNPMAADIYLEALQESHRGQGIDIYWRDNFICPTEEEYIDMLKLKTAPYFIFVAKMLKLFSSNKSNEDYVNIAILIGVYFNLRDDYNCNLFNHEGLKSLSETDAYQVSIITEEVLRLDSDITEGKFSLPIIHALESHSESASQILNILKQRTRDVTLINYCISTLKELACDSYTENMLRTLETEIQKEINRLGGNPVLASLIKELGNWRRQGME